MARDFYDVLGVARDASDDEIREAYRKLARQHHPDRNPGDKKAAERFKEIQQAYDVLRDKTKRAQYDRAPYGAPGGGFYSNQAPGGFSAEFDLSDLLGQMGGTAGGSGGLNDFLFGGGGPGGHTRRPRPAPTIEASLSIPFMTAALGGAVSVSVNGRELDVRVPEGAEEGTKLRLRGQAPGGGDVIVQLQVQTHSYFHREGNDVVLEVPLSVTEAVLGTKVDVPTLRGERLSVTIKPGTSSGARRRLPGFGIKGGDQYLEIKIVAPTQLDEKSRELYETLARQDDLRPRDALPWA